jgi:hypothetical protein
VWQLLIRVAFLHTDKQIYRGRQEGFAVYIHILTSTIPAFISAYTRYDLRQRNLRFTPLYACYGLVTWDTAYGVLVHS